MVIAGRHVAGGWRQAWQASTRTGKRGRERPAGSTRSRLISSWRLIIIHRQSSISAGVWILSGWSGPDPPVVAKLTGAAQRHANWHELSETAAEVAKLQEIIGRPDGASLLPKVAASSSAPAKAIWMSRERWAPRSCASRPEQARPDHAVDRGRAPTKGDRQQAAVPRHCRTGDPRTGRLGRMTSARTAYLQ